jgi:hypothetical protein
VWILCVALVSVLKVYSIPASEILVLPVLYVLHSNVKSIFGTPSYKDPLILFGLSYSSVVLSLIMQQPALNISVFVLANVLGFLLISSDSKRRIFEVMSFFLKTLRPSLQVIRGEQRL